MIRRQRRTVHNENEGGSGSFLRWNKLRLGVVAPLSSSRERTHREIEELDPGSAVTDGFNDVHGARRRDRVSSQLTEVKLDSISGNEANKHARKNWFKKVPNVPQINGVNIHPD